MSARGEGELRGICVSGKFVEGEGGGGGGGEKEQHIHVRQCISKLRM